MILKVDDAAHTVVVSDLHLSDAEPVDPRRPLWRRFRRADLFVDESFGRFLGHLRREVGDRIELIFNGDAFDFDSVTAIPEDPPYRVSWLERRRGLVSEQAKSEFKIRRILRDHVVWVEALHEFLSQGNHVVFVIGNHDLELHWPAVQKALRDALDPEGVAGERLRICEFFTLAGGDTLVTHGNQFDTYNLCANPIHPFVWIGGRSRVRMPVGNLANKLMLNGMGLFNPHLEASYIKSLWEYAIFFFRYVMRIQPLLAWSWLWSAVATFLVSLNEGFRPAHTNPFTVEARVDEMARRSRTRPGVVRTLKALSVHPAVFHPWRLARELWLDRALLLALAVWATFHVAVMLEWVAGIQPWWGLLAFLLLLPPYLFYARRVTSDLARVERVTQQRAPRAARAAGVDRVVLGHTHIEYHSSVRGIELLNTGTWSPAFHDVSCTEPYGRKGFAWIAPERNGQRRARLFEWKDPQAVEIPRSEGRPPSVLAHLTETLSGEKTG